MANIKLTGNTWDTSGIYDAEQEKTQAEVNSGLKNAVDAQSEQIDDIEDVSAETISFTLSGTGTVDSKNGNTTTSSVNSYTDYIDVSKYDYILYKREGSTSANPTGGIAFYDSTKAYISGDQLAGGQVSAGYVSGLAKKDVPNNAKYVRCSVYTNTSAYGSFEIYGVTKIKNSIDSNTKNVEILNNLLAFEELAPVKTTSNRALGGNGALLSLSSNSVLEYKVDTLKYLKVNVADRSTETNSVTFAFYSNSSVESTYVIANTICTSGYSGIIEIPDNAVRMAVSQKSDNITNSVKCLVTDKKCKAKYINSSGLGSSTERIEVFIPAKKGYIEYDFVHSVNDSINADVWRVHTAYAVSNDLNNRFALTETGEWEIALHLADRDDFSGGIAHGDEVASEILFFLDGKKISLSDISGLSDFNEFRIVEKSTMYDPADNTTQICIHGSEHIFTKDGLVINQSIKWLGSFSTTTCYMAMYPSKKMTGTDKIYMDSNFGIVSLDTSDYRNEYPDTKSACIFNETSDYFAEFSAPTYPTGLTGGDELLVADNGGSGYNKMYYVVTTGTAVQENDLWKSQTIYKLNVAT